MRHGTIEIEYVLSGLLAAEAGAVEWQAGGCKQRAEWLKGRHISMKEAWEQVLFTHPIRAIEMRRTELLEAGEEAEVKEMKNRKDVFVV